MIADQDIDPPRGCRREYIAMEDHMRRINIWNVTRAYIYAQTAWSILQFTRIIKLELGFC